MSEMNQEEINQLLEKYRMGQCAEEEQVLLFSWYKEQAEKPSAMSQREVEDAERHMWDNLQKHIHRNTRHSSRRLWPVITAAASVLILIAAAVYFFNPGLPGSAGLGMRISYANDVAPGRNTATLELANGKTIKLSSAKEAVVINASQLSYNDGTNLLDSGNDPLAGTGGAAGDITVATPRGGTYQVVLPDGTKVWLNAASSIKFPARFERSGARKVQLSGEAYFEVAKIMLFKNGQPVKQAFKVVTEHQEVEVLGTHFNISSYADESDTRTTLIEGAVRVTPLDLKGGLSGSGEVMKPGQQAILLGNNIRLSTIDAEETIAWKKGYFLFKEEPLPSIMRKIARWYDVDVSYTSDMHAVSFEGTMSRFNNVSEILRKFELTDNAHFKIEGRRITVMP